MYKKSNSFVYIFLVNYQGLFQILRQGVLWKAENWYASSHEPYFSEHRFFQISLNVPLQQVLVFTHLLLFLDDNVNKESK